MVSPTFLLNVADWLAAPESHAVASDDQALLGALVLAAAHLEHLETLEAPAASLAAQLRSAASEIPPQWAMLADDEPFAMWLQAATVAEHRGAFRLSLRMLSELARLLSIKLRNDVRDDGSLIAERLALCCARRGRIARTMGELEHAMEWYGKAREAVRYAPVRDASPQASLGLAALALNRGNIPRGARLLMPLLRRGAGLPAVYRIPTHQLMAVVRRKQRKHMDALLHVWAAFDLLTTSDFRREQLVGTMAEIALEAGDIDAAARGFEVVLQSSTLPMVRVPALWGAIQARLASAPPHRDPLQDAPLLGFMAEVQVLKTQRLAPAAEVMVHLSDATLAIARADVRSATTALDEADRVAHSAGFFERQFMIEELRTRLRIDQLTGSATPSGGRAQEQQQRKRRVRHPALLRLLQIA